MRRYYQFRFVFMIAFNVAVLLVFGLTVASTQAKEFPLRNWQVGKIVRPARYYTVKVHYPILCGSALKARVINHQIKTFVDKQLEQAYTRLTSYCGDGLAAPKGYIKGRYNIELAGPNILSVRFDFSAYAPGAAHPEDWTTAFNYSLISLKQLSLEDIFRSDIDYEEALSVLSIDHLLRSNPSLKLNWLEEGAGPSKDNFKNFLLTKDFLRIYFNEYQVEAYAQGLGIVDIPYVKIQELIRLNRALGALATKANLQKNAEDVLSRPNLEVELARIAIGSYSRVIEKNPEDGLAYFRRGKWYQKLNREVIGQQDLKKASDLGYYSNF